MIHPTPADIGRIVLYYEHENAEIPEHGRISSIREEGDEIHVWVRYGLSSTGQLTPCERLFWE